MANHIIKAIGFLFLLNLVLWKFANVETGTAGIVFKLLLLTQSALIVTLAYSNLRYTSEKISLDRRIPGTWKQACKYFFWGSALCLIGDAINIRIVDLTAVIEVQTLLSIPFFGVAHIFYILAFFSISAKYLVANPRMMSYSLLAWPVLAVGAWWLLIGADAPSVVKWLSLPYAFLVTGMAIASVWPYMAIGKAAWSVVVGGWAFVISDGIIAYNLPDQATRETSFIIWIIYIYAQWMIVSAPQSVPKDVEKEEERQAI